MSPSLQSILGDEALAAFEAPGAVARGLPAAAYTSEAFFALENERIFAESWVFAGLAHELARPGDAVPVAVAGKPVLLVRDDEGEVRAFHNVCRHRCLKLVEEPGNVGPAIQCPYHSWPTSSTARCTSPPISAVAIRVRCRPGFDKAQHGLVPVRVATWHDWVFVNLNGGAPPLEDVVARSKAGRRARHQPDAARRHSRPGRDRRELEAPDGELHRALPLPFVHATTTEQPLTDHYTLNEPGCLGCAVDVSRTAKRDDTLSADSRYLTVLPQLLIGDLLP